MHDTKSHTDMVREFMRAFGQDTPPKPILPDDQIRHLRRMLNSEENDELWEAKNPVEALDAIADLLYVVEGAAVAYGFTAQQVDAAFREVHRSNMSKLWTLVEVETLPAGYTAHRSHLPGLFIVKNDLGKVVKSPTYSRASLEDIVGGEG